MKTVPANSGKPLSAKIYVVFVKGSKLEVYNFSTIQLAKDYVKTLNSKECVIIVGNIATEGLKGI